MESKTQGPIIGLARLLSLPPQFGLGAAAKVANPNTVLAAGHPQPQQTQKGEGSLRLELEKFPIDLISLSASQPVARELAVCSCAHDHGPGVARSDDFPIATVSISLSCPSFFLASLLLKYTSFSPSHFLQVWHQPMGAHIRVMEEQGNAVEQGGGQKNWNDPPQSSELPQVRLNDALALQSQYNSLVRKMNPYVISHSEQVHVSQLSSSSLHTTSETKGKASYRERKWFYRTNSGELRTILALEGERSQLHEELEQTRKELISQKSTHAKQVEKLESQLEWLQSCVDAASTRIEDLEKINARLREHQREANASRSSPGPARDEERVGELTERCTRLEAAKLALEKRLQNATKDLRALHEEYDSIQFARQDYNRLQECYKKLTEHVWELERQVEEQRVQIEMRSPPSPADTDSTDEDEYEECRIDVPGDREEGMRRRARRDGPRRALLTELEQEWIKEIQATRRINSSASMEGPASSESSPLPQQGKLIDRAPRSNWRTLTEIGNSVFDAVIDGTVGLVCFVTRQTQYADSLRAAVRRGVAGLLLRLVRKVFTFVFRWCAFVGLLVCAFAKELWRGPT
ncbi:uncharacterized protein VTP21DRAFT_3569 [Calcarisporiella thermophila]|uniref:uncharacterized protein n=1 Tax=Calcarisporiella thermophila TaxID=911321 RepID=UPI003742DF6D